MDRSATWLVSPINTRGTHLSTIVEDNREPEPDSDSVSESELLENSTLMESLNRFGFEYPKVPGSGSGRRHPKSAAMNAIPRGSTAAEYHRNRRVDFDELYDATDEESDCDGDSCSPLSYKNNDHSGQRNKYPIIFIPSQSDTALRGSKLNSPVPPTPPPKIPVSPEALSRLPKIVPPIYDAPSLAGSTTGSSSAHPSNPSAPPTPEIGPVPDTEWDEYRLRVYSNYEFNENSVSSSRSMSPQLDIQLETPEDWSLILNHFPRAPRANDEIREAVRRGGELQESASVKSSNKGVQLPRGALDTLRHFDIDDRSSLSSDGSDGSDGSDVDEIGQMSEQLSDRNIRRRSTGGLRAPSTACSETAYTPLSIPSPGGFFASLNIDTRRTWYPNNNPPSSATVERFYGRPWDAAGEHIVEQVVKVDEDDDDDTVGPPTARRIPPGESMTDDLTLVEDVDMLVEYDELYEEELSKAAATNFDRTGVWLAAQSGYLAALAETNPTNKVGDAKPGIELVSNDNTSVSITKKSVRFLDTVSEEPGMADDHTPIMKKNSVFYHGFRHVLQKSRKGDTFNHSYFRFEAIQAARISLMEKYIDHLAGRYEPSNPVRPAYRGPFSLAPRNSTLPETLHDKDMYAKVEPEQDVLKQIQHSMWVVDALKYLNGGRLIPSPASRRLARARGSIRGSARVLDLGGHPTCDWGWYVAGKHSNAKVYTVVTKDQPVNSKLKGPTNHRHVSVPQLWNLPFQEGQFDLISTRHMHMLLKSDRLVEGVDEYDHTLNECFRCLKPGGYLEFFIMDAELARAGPYGSATSIEFAFNLKTRGYDPRPTRLFLSRLKKAGFVGMKRAWIFLPMGVAPNTVTDMEEQGTGSTAAVASTTGIFGGWMWEQWMHRMQTEMGRDKDSFLQQMSTVFGEGRKSGAGWRCLVGWAMKPKTGGSGNAAVPQTPPPLPPSRPSTRL